MPTILVTGGAGYIGSHTLLALNEAGYETLVYDSLERGHRGAVAGHRLIVGDLFDRACLEQVFSRQSVDAVVHFAAYIESGESVRDPGRYFRNNVAGTLSLLEAMVEAGVGRMVFSSTAAVYGNPASLPIDEDSPLAPESPYGRSKQMVEEMLAAFEAAHGLRSIRLRYFNAAGADPAGRLGEDHNPESHLIPLALQVALGQREDLRIFGDDYPTPDGTCIRDYVHVSDLADAHAMALRALEQGGASATFNVGTGHGASVMEVITAARQVTGAPIPVTLGPRREGDPARLVANADRIRRALGWEPRRPGLEEMVASAWAWRRAHPNGYGKR